MDQQQQTQQYFRSAAQDWQHKAVNVVGAYSVIEGRNRAVLSAIEATTGAKRFLDVGCGTGQLVLASAQRGLEAHGIDFAEEMIAQCEVNRQNANVSANFVCGSFFDLPADEGAYDVISAQGFIEYISPQQMEQFFARCFGMLRSGGSLVIGSRNRLYNAFSLNAFTLMEMQLGTLDALLGEAVALQTSTTQGAAFDALRQHERHDPQPDAHPVTGIGVDIRYQYTPAELVGRLRKHGFMPNTLFPIHFHGLPPAVKVERPDIHSQLATLMMELGATDHRLAPFSSSFVLDVRKGK